MIPSYNLIDNKWEGVSSQEPLLHPKFYEMYRHVHSTQEFVKISYSKKSKDLEFIPFGFKECCCANNAFHRIQSPRRNTLENAIVDRLKNHEKTDLVHLLSMGSGGLMGDFILLEKLVLAGFKTINLDCVEPKGFEECQLEKLRGFFSDIPGISVTIGAFKDIEDVLKKEYMCVTAIDYSEVVKTTTPKTLKTTADLMRAYSTLNGSGFLALGYAKEEDNLFGPTMDPIPLHSESSAIYRIVLSVKKLLSEKKELVLALPTLTGNSLAQQAMMCVSLASKNASLEKVFVHVESTAIDKDKELLPDFEKMMGVMFPGIFEITLGEKPSTKQPDINFVI